MNQMRDSYEIFYCLIVQAPLIAIRNESFHLALSSNSEAFASELLENLGEMLPLYHMDIDVIYRFKYSTTHWCITHRERFNHIISWVYQRQHS